MCKMEEQGFLDTGEKHRQVDLFCGKLEEILNHCGNRAVLIKYKGKHNFFSLHNGTHVQHSKNTHITQQIQMFVPDKIKCTMYM